jgi:crossover junction endodeoxyribonuclease RuvC
VLDCKDAAMPFSVRPQHSMSPHQRYLGIDPGLNRTGYALLERTSAGPILLEGGIIQSTTSSTLHERVHEIGTGVREVLDELQPGVVAIEQVFSHRQNLRTALVLAQARGAILMCVVDTGIPVIHYSPTEIKRLSALSRSRFGVGRENGVRYRKPERPEGCFAFSVPDPLFQRTTEPELLAVTKH